MQPSVEIVKEGNDVSYENTININLGILGHVDSGKTAISKLLSTIASTSCFDKIPQSKERGITIELGFSAFIIKIPLWFQQKHHLPQSKQYLQFTLVDCPGHSTLIRTVIGGASIIDVFILLIDGVRGVQVQTSECILLAEIIHKPMICLLNKVDMYEEALREEKIGKMKTSLLALFSKVFSDQVPIFPVIATYKDNTNQKIKDLGEKYVTDFIYGLLNVLKVPVRSTVGKFIFSADHCFLIKGKGTVLTGTVLQGNAIVGDEIEIPSIGEIKKIKSIQVFHKPVPKITEGDRAGICITQLDSNIVNI